LRDENDFERHADYIHFNPVKHGHVTCVSDWPFSSFHRMVRLGSIRKTGRAMLLPPRETSSAREDGFRTMPLVGWVERSNRTLVRFDRETHQRLPA
jgi:hypothetical protein